MQQRQIKFRAWDKDGNLVPNAITFSTTPRGFVWPDTPHVGMKAYEQFTGLLDKNGKEVYEGDIVRVALSNGNVREETVEWNADNAQYDVFCSDCGHCSYIDGHPARSCEVIGNIHENPDLIESGATTQEA